MAGSSLTTPLIIKARRSSDVASRHQSTSLIELRSGRALYGLHPPSPTHSSEPFDPGRHSKPLDQVTIAFLQDFNDPHLAIDCHSSRRPSKPFHSPSDDSPQPAGPRPSASGRSSLFNTEIVLPSRHGEDLDPDPSSGQTCYFPSSFWRI